MFLVLMISLYLTVNSYIAILLLMKAAKFKERNLRNKIPCNKTSG